MPFLSPNKQRQSTEGINYTTTDAVLNVSKVVNDVSRLLCLPVLQVVNIFNLFITYGDTFLPNPNSYDELYYEIVRMHQVFDNLYSMGKSLFVVVY